ncbi:MAG: hypothetical protein J0L78_06080 [Planctomycetes bacterium]|nr:hypothetical protein [Planctomycetota bacterium]
MSAMMNDEPLPVLHAAAAKARTALGLRYLPVVIRSESSAFAVADRTSASVVMLGEDAFWVVCLADAAKLERAGYEWAPRPSAR